MGDDEKEEEEANKEMEEGKKKRRRKRIPKDAQREYFIKWKDMSYWHCSWCQEIQLDVFHPQTYRMYLRKNDMDGTVQYLVKWVDLNYNESSWEDEDEEIPDLPLFFQNYDDLRFVCGADGTFKKK